MSEEQQVEAPEAELVIPEVPDQPQERQYSETEKRAMDLGWKPKETWVEEGHEEADHRSARDFLERGEMIGKLRSQERELQNQRAALQKLAQSNQKIYENGYKSAIAELKQEKRQALQEGDLVKADEINDQIHETQQQIDKLKQEPVVNAPVIDPEFETWIQLNPWYNDRTMRKFADALGIDFVKDNNGQVTMAQTRDYVTKVVKEEFKHRFEKKPVVGAPNPDGSGRGKANGDKNSEANQLSKVKSGLSEEERSIMKTTCRATGMTEAQYLKMYSEA